MNEYLASIIIYLVFLVGSLFFRKRMMKVKSRWSVFLFVTLYFIATYFYFEAINKFHEILRDHQFYIDFGHASLLLLLDVFVICLLTSIFIVTNIVYSSLKQKALF